MNTACFGLGGPPRVGRPYRSADGFDDPITPGGVSARGPRDDLPGAILPAPLRGYRTSTTSGNISFTTGIDPVTCNLMPETALRTAIGDANRMKFIQREPKRLKDLPMQVGSQMSPTFHYNGV